MPVTDLAREFGVEAITVKRALRRLGVEIIVRDTPPATPEMIAVYQGGESILAMSRRLNISRETLAERLRVAGVTLRGVKNNGSNSYAARCRAALTNELRLGLASPHEQGLLRMLSKRGLDPIPQRAVGPYNIDIAVMPIAVEIVSGWHSSPPKIAAHRERTKYLLRRGWDVVVVARDVRKSISPKVADKIVALVEEARSDPTVRSQYRVLTTNGKPSTAFSLDLDQ